MVIKAISTDGKVIASVFDSGTGKILTDIPKSSEIIEIIETGENYLKFTLTSVIQFNLSHTKLVQNLKWGRCSGCYFDLRHTFRFENITNPICLQEAINFFPIKSAIMKRKFRYRLNSYDKISADIVIMSLLAFYPKYDNFSGYIRSRSLDVIEKYHIYHRTDRENKYHIYHRTDHENKYHIYHCTDHENKYHIYHRTDRENKYHIYHCTDHENKYQIYHRTDRENKYHIYYRTDRENKYHIYHRTDRENKYHIYHRTDRENKYHIYHRTDHENKYHIYHRTDRENKYHIYHCTDRENKYHIHHRTDHEK